MGNGNDNSNIEIELTAPDLKTSVENLSSAVDAGKTALEVFEKAKDTMQKLSKFGAVLGVLGVAMDIVSMFMGEQSTEDIIIEKLDKLDNRITSLTQKITQQFEDLKDWHILHDIETKVFDAIRDLSTLYTEPDPKNKLSGDVYIFLELNKKVNKRYNDENRDLPEPEKKKLFWDTYDPEVFTPSYIETLPQDEQALIEQAKNITALIDTPEDYKTHVTSHVHDLVDLVTRPPMNGKSNLFDALYISFYGNYRRILNHGLLIYSTIFETAKAVNTIRQTQAKLKTPADFNYDVTVYGEGESEDGTPALAGDVAFFRAALESIQNALDDAMKFCANNVFDNIKMYCETDLFLKIGNNTPLDTSDAYKQAAIKLANDLHKNYDWLDFTAIVYDPVWGCENHYFFGPYQPASGVRKAADRGVLNWFRQAVGDADKSVNIIV